MFDISAIQNQLFLYQQQFFNSQGFGGFPGPMNFHYK